MSGRAARPVVRAVVAAALLVGAGATATSAQDEPLDVGRGLSEIELRLRPVLAALRDRRQALAREASLLRALAAAGGAITQYATTSQVGAREALERAAAKAAQDPPLAEPVPKVLRLLTDLLERPGVGVPAERLRARYFTLLHELELDVLDGMRAAQRDQAALHRLAAGLAGADSTAANEVALVLRLAIEAHEIALQ